MRKLLFLLPLLVIGGCSKTIWDYALHERIKEKPLVGFLAHSENKTCSVHARILERKELDNYFKNAQELLETYVPIHFRMINHTDHLLRLLPVNIMPTVHTPEKLEENIRCKVFNLYKVHQSTIQSGERRGILVMYGGFLVTAFFASALGSLEKRHSSVQNDDPGPITLMLLLSGFFGSFLTGLKARNDYLEKFLSINQELLDSIVSKKPSYVHPYSRTDRLCFVRKKDFVDGKFSFSLTDLDNNHEQSSYTLAFTS